MIHKTTRSILSVLLAALLLVASIPLTPAFAGGGGVSQQSESGESEGLEQVDGEYQIYTAEELLKFAELVNGGETDADAKLMNDIDLNGSEENPWTPIGNIIDEEDPDSFGYTGTFDGNGHTISGLYIDSNADYQGLFGYVSGTVQNLTVSGSVSGGEDVGGIVGYNFSGTVTNCAFSGNVSGSIVGGVVGYNSGASASASVTNCYNTGNVSGPDNVNGETIVNVGGVVGSNSFSASVTNCYNTGNVSGPDNVNGETTVKVGGVVGQSFGGTVENCYNIGEVSSLDSGSDSNVGGVVGQNSSSGTVKNCYNTGAVSGLDSGSDSNVGGVVGQNFSASVTNCYNTGEVSGLDSGSDSNVGGVVGQSFKASVTNCYNTGKVSGPDSGSGSYVGGVVGNNRFATVTDCYFLKTDDVNSNLQGIGNDRAEGAKSLTADEFKNQNSFTNWDFGSTDTTDTWSLSENLGRPVLTSNHEDDGTQAHP